MTTQLESVPVLAPGDVIAPGYRILQHVSRGEALDVYEVFSEERLSSCMAKTVRPDRADVQRVRDRLLQEGELLSTLAHPHLSRAFETIHEPVPVVIIETIAGIDLDELIACRARRLPMTDLAHLGRQLCSAAHFLHGRGFLHLDIRPANVMLTCGIAQLIDLSLARPPGTAPRGYGTREYMSPEQALGKDLTTASDVWGIGVTLYEAATAAPPFSPHDEREEADHRDVGYFQLRRPAPPLIRWRRRLPAPFEDLLQRCLCPEPTGRPQVTDVFESLGAFVEPDDVDPDKPDDVDPDEPDDPGPGGRPAQIGLAGAAGSSPRGQCP